MGAEEVKRVQESTRRHVEFGMRLCRIQDRHGLCFMHEGPRKAESWNNEDVERVIGMRNVRTVDGGRCEYEMKRQRCSLGVNFEDASRIITNSEEIARSIARMVDTHESEGGRGQDPPG